MLGQQDTYKAGERSVAATRYFCATCDRRQVESIVELDEGDVFPTCSACTAAGRTELDQYWVRLAERDAWRRRAATRWRDVQKP
ncbi:MAG: hypothetical protein KBD01_05845 [Acidobacteria bacterium]|nr:hypothetical protein [Acidobacteriota bacterium]